MACVTAADIEMVEVFACQVMALSQFLIRDRPDLCQIFLPWLLFQGFGKDLFWTHHSWALAELLETGEGHTYLRCQQHE